MKSELEEFANKYGLSRREREILGLLADKVVNFKEIAQHLSLSPSTVNNHFKNIFEKTGTNSKSELLAACLERVNEKYVNARPLIKKPQVLVVDDEQEICEIIQKGLALRGVKVHIFSDPVEAIRSVGDLKLDVVISDIRMPKMDGIQLLRELRVAHRYFPSFVFFTGYHEDGSIERYMDMGAAALLEKPLDLDKLYHVIMELFIDDTQERSRYLNLDKTNPIRLGPEFNVPASHVGYGGIFLPVTEGMREGTHVSLAFRLGNDPNAIQILGEVAWHRPIAQADLPSGVGVKFLKIAEGDLARVHDFVRKHRILSFIPRAQTGTAGLSAQAH